MWVGNFDPVSITSKLVEFSHFNDFFPDLAKFQDFDVFLLFDFPDLDNFLDFLACFIPFLSASNPSILLLPLFLLEAGLLLLFLLEADLLPLFMLGAGLSDN